MRECTFPTSPSFFLMASSVYFAVADGRFEDFFMLEFLKAVIGTRKLIYKLKYFHRLKKPLQAVLILILY